MFVSLAELEQMVSSFLWPLFRIASFFYGHSNYRYTNGTHACAFGLGSGDDGIDRAGFAGDAQFQRFIS